MSKCENMQALISQMLDGELSEDEAAQVRAHIAQCDDCRAMYEAFAAVSAAVRADEEEVPADLHENIMSTVNAAKKATKGQRKFMQTRSMLTAAACLVVVVGTVFALGSTMFGRMGRTMSGGNGSAAPMAPAAADKAAAYSSSMTSGTSASTDASGGTDEAYFTTGNVIVGATAGSSAPESVACAPESMPDAAWDEELIKDSDMSADAPMEAPSAAGTSVLLTMTVELTERMDERTFSGYVRACADNVFPVGERVTLYLEDGAAEGLPDDLPRLASVEYHGWDDCTVYVSGISIEE